MTTLLKRAQRAGAAANIAAVGATQAAVRADVNRLDLKLREAQARTPLCKLYP